jgi:hypothetical protein
MGKHGQGGEAKEEAGQDPSKIQFQGMSELGEAKQQAQTVTTSQDAAIAMSHLPGGCRRPVLREKASARTGLDENGGSGPFISGWRSLSDGNGS